jgi:YNFM family putative membrane transporter
MGAEYTSADELLDRAGVRSSCLPRRADSPLTPPSAEARQVERGTPAFRKINIAVFAAGFSTFLLMYAVQPLLPIFAAEFHISAAASSLALSLTTACLAVSMLVVGAVAEGGSRKPIMSVSLMSVALLTLLSSTVSTWPALLAIRTIEGVALAGLPALAMAYVGEEIHPDAVGVSMGLYVGSGALGGMTGRLLTGVLADLFSWRPALAVIGAIGIVASVIFSSSLPASAMFKPRSLSVRSLLASYAAHLRDPVIVALVAEAFLILGSLVTVYNYTGFRLLAPPYSLSQSVVGSVFGLYLLGFFSSSLMGMLSHRFNRPHLLQAGLATMFAGVALTAARPLWAILAGTALVTIGFFAAQSVASSWIGLRAREAKTQASALYLFFYYMGGSIAGSVGGFFWTAYGWNGVATFLAGLLTVGLGIATTKLRTEAR